MKREILAYLLRGMINEINSKPEEYHEKFRDLESLPLLFAFPENSEAERSHFWGRFNSPSAVKERSFLNGVARIQEASEVSLIMSLAGRALGITEGLVGSALPEKVLKPYLEELEAETHAAAAEIGLVILGWIKERRHEPFLEMAKAVEGKRTAASEKKREILEVFFRLCDGAERLPTKGEVRSSFQSGSLDERRLRKYMGDLGLSGLPNGKPGPKSK